MISPHPLRARPAPAPLGGLDTRTRRAASGFSLIELLIVIAIIGIISAVAYPSYSEYVQKTRRTDAQLSLLSGVQAMERCKSTRYTYVGCTVPTTSPEGHYTLAISDRTGSAFTLTATAVTGGLQAGDTGCTALTIDETSARGPTADDGSVPCWN